MDYKYINQLLERYWQGQTSVEEEQILRSFFSQDDVPAALKKYSSLFVYENVEPRRDTLGKDFDERILSMTAEPKAVKARVITLRQRLTPLFKAAAIVAILLSLSNAAQMSFSNHDYQDVSAYDRAERGESVALTDSAKVDTLKQGAQNVIEAETPVPMIK